MKYPRKIFSIIVVGTLLLACKNTEENKKEIPAAEELYSSENDCMDRIIEKDAALGKARNEATTTLPTSEAIDIYVDGMEALDFRKCPGPFIAAFEDHIEAWASIKEITDKYPDLRGEMHDVFDQLERTEDGDRFKFLLADIWSTWEKVERAMSQF